MSLRSGRFFRASVDEVKSKESASIIDTSSVTPISPPPFDISRNRKRKDACSPTSTPIKQKAKESKSPVSLPNNEIKDQPTSPPQLTKKIRKAKETKSISTSDRKLRVREPRPIVKKPTRRTGFGLTFRASDSKEMIVITANPTSTSQSTIKTIPPGDEYKPHLYSGPTNMRANTTPDRDIRRALRETPGFNYQSPEQTEIIETSLDGSPLVLEKKQRPHTRYIRTAKTFLQRLNDAGEERVLSVSAFQTQESAAHIPPGDNLAPTFSKKNAALKKVTLPPSDTYVGEGTLGPTTKAPHKRKVSHKATATDITKHFLELEDEKVQQRSEQSHLRANCHGAAPSISKDGTDEKITFPAPVSGNTERLVLFEKYIKILIASMEIDHKNIAILLKNKEGKPIPVLESETAEFKTEKGSVTFLIDHKTKNDDNKRKATPAKQHYHLGKILCDYALLGKTQVETKPKQDDQPKSKSNKKS